MSPESGSQSPRQISQARKALLGQTLQADACPGGSGHTLAQNPPPQESWEKRLPAGASKEAGWAAPRAGPPSGARPSSPRDRLQGGLGRPLGRGEAEAVKGPPHRRANLEAPLFLLAGTNPDFATSSEPDKWLICNINVTGYFRVNYDQDNWDRLMGQLESNHTVGQNPPPRSPHQPLVFPSAFGPAAL